MAMQVNTIRRSAWRLRAAAMALVLALAGCVGGGSSVSSEATLVAPTPPSSLPVTIKNSSGETAYVKFTGDTTKTFAVSPASATIAAGGSATFNVANISAGRIYISYGTALSSDSPDGANPADPDYHTRFDKVEITYNQGSGGSANLTAVDFYAIPMVLETSIQGTTIDQLTLATGQTGNGVLAEIRNAVAAGQTVPVVNTTTGTFARVLSPVKAPAAYGSFDAFLDTLTASTLTISGTYFGAASQPYGYSGTIGPHDITLTNTAHTIKISRGSLAFNATDLVDHNGIYTCDAPFTVDGQLHEVSDNDIYAAVYRDLVAGFNLGFVQQGANASSGWWTSPAFPSSSFQGTYYNAYAKAIADNYPGAYGFPFSDRYRQVLADLGGLVDAVTIEIVGDSAVVPPYTPQGTVNPQTASAGSPTINMVLVTSDDNFDQTTFTFDLQSFQGGTVNTFASTNTGSAGTNAAQVNGIPSQDGLNIYTLQLRGRRYSVLVQVTGGAVAWASIAGGGNANWSAPNLFVGGL
jgi:hypothetical protein